MFWAAMGGRLEIIKFLSCDGIAHDDIRRVNRFGCSPFRIALHFDHVAVWKWLILNGALAPSDDDFDGGVIIDNMMMRNNICQLDNVPWDDDKRLTVLALAQNVVTNHDNVTLLSASSPPLVIFDGKSGILKLVVDYVGNPTPEELCLFRRLLKLLPAFIADVPFVPTSRRRRRR